MSQQQYWQFEIFGTDPDIIGFFGDAGIILPGGTTAERPSSPSVGHIRYNTDLGQFEGFNGGWLTFETGAATTFDALTDTPAGKAGSANRVMIVNSGETALEYSSALTLENDGTLLVGTASYETLVVTDDVVPNKRYVDDQDALQLSLSGGLMTGTITMGGNAISGLPLTPTAASEAASKSYVDGLFAGIDRKESVRLATTTDLNSETGDSWVPAGSGVGKTITSDANTATIDGVAVVNGDRILIKDEAGDIDNGIYDVSGVGGAAVVLTRSTDMDGTPSNEVSGGTTTFVVEGTTNAATQWSVIHDGSLTVDTDPMVWTVTTILSGTFLELAGGTMVGNITFGAASTQILGDTTTTTVPSYSFVGDTGTGLHQTSGAGTLALVIGATSSWNYTATALTPAVTETQDIGSAGLKMRDVYADHFLPNFGAAGDPSYSFEGDSDTGMFNGGGDDLEFAIGGTIVASFTTSELDLTAPDGTGAGAGGVIDINAGTGGATGDGGTVAITAGSGGGTSGDGADITLTGGGATDGSGGNIDLLAGSGAGTNQAGGGVTVYGGDSTGSADGGPVALSGGTGGTTAAGGYINITAGDGGATSGDGGSVTITGGDVSSASGDNGGSVTLVAGQGSTSDEDGTIVFSTQRSSEIEVFYGYSETGVTGAATTLMTIPIPSDDSAIFEVFGIARSDSATAGFRIFGVVEEDGGATIAGSTATDTSNSGGDSADWNLTVDVSGSNLIVVTDNDAEDVDWKLKVRLTSINLPFGGGS